MKIISKEYLGEQEVYDIGVASLNGAHNFVLENGMVASNCFNKAHSVSYSILTYITAYMKAHYPVEFFTALMSTRSKTLQPKSWAMKAPEYISEAKKFEVNVYPPSVNQSGYEFTISNNEVYFGLNAIRDVGKTAARMIIKARQKTSFKNVKDFLHRVNLQKVNTKVFEALIKAGAFDKMGYSRSELLESTSDIYKYVRDLDAYNQREIDYIKREHHNIKVNPLIERRNFLRKEIKKLDNRISKGKEKEGDLDLLVSYETELPDLEDLGLKRLPALARHDKPVFPELTRNSIVELNFKEIMDQARYIGCYIGGHPFHLISVQKDDLSLLEKGEWCNVAGVILSIKEIKTRAGKYMAFIEIDDSTASAELIAFPSIWKKIKELQLQETDLIKCKVKVEQTSPDVKLILNKIERIETDEVDA
jgi:DNA polymerase III subunit alpha